MSSDPFDHFRILKLGKFSIFLAPVFLVLIGFVALFSTIYFGSFACGIGVALALFVSLLIKSIGHVVANILCGVSSQTSLRGLANANIHALNQTYAVKIFVLIAGPFLQALAGSAVFALRFSLQSKGLLPLPIDNSLAAFSYISVVWGCANLFIPVLPLDCGKILFYTASKFSSPSNAILLTYKVGVFISFVFFVCSLFFVTFGGTVSFVAFGVAIISVYFFFKNYQDLKFRERFQAFLSQKIKQARAIHAKIQHIEDTFSAENWRETTRLCHVIRTSSDRIPEITMRRIWYILGVCSINLGEYEEALEWLKRAPQTNEVEQLTSEAKEKLKASC